MYKEKLDAVVRLSEIIFHERELFHKKRSIAKMAIDERIRSKANSGEKAVIVFLCTTPSAWLSLQPVFESMLHDKLFTVKIFTCPVRRLGEDFANDNKIYNYFKDFPCEVVSARTNTGWYDLANLEPDYVFYQTPYNAGIPDVYNSSYTGEYAKICYSSYGVRIFSGDVVSISNPQDFLRDTSFIFCENAEAENQVRHFLDKALIPDLVRIFTTGHPRLDYRVKFLQAESPLWKNKRSKDFFRVIWTTRWNMDEGNSHFLEYKDAFIDFFKGNRDFDCVFRPHPLTFHELESKGFITSNELESYKESFDNSSNMVIDNTDDYLSTFYSSDVLVADMSSILFDYFLTGKPIVYCHKTDSFNDFGHTLAKGFYWARNWEEVLKTVSMLRSGNDPLYEKRQLTIKDYLKSPVGGVGNLIKSIIKRDYLSTLG